MRFGNLTSMRLRLTLSILLLVGAVCASAAETKLPISFKTSKKQRAGFWTARVKYPEFGGGSAFADFANVRWKNIAGKAFNQFTEFVASSFKAGSKKPTAPWSLDSSPQIALARPGIVSGYQTTYDYTGGAHPNTRHVAISIGMVAGKATKLTLRDVLKTGVSVPDFLTKEVLPILNSMKRTRGATEATALDADLADQFFITPTSLTWAFSPYEVGAYAEGSYFVKVPFERVLTYLDGNGPLRGMIPAENSGGPGTVVIQPNSGANTEPKPPVTQNGRTIFSGSAGYLQRIALLPGSRLEIVVVDRTKSDAPVVLLVTAIEASKVPIPFDFRLDTSAWTDQTIVEAEFQIKNGDKTLFRSEKPLALPKSGWTKPQELMLKMVAGD